MSTRIAIVTGGTRGIGRAVTEQLLDEGWKVWFCGRTPETVGEALDELKEASDHLAGRVVDVTDVDAVDGFIDEVLEREGRIDLLVNNAGVGYFAPIDEIDPQDWRRVLATNLDGCFYFLRAVAPTMRSQGSGLIVNIASLAARNPFAGGAAYNASKFGLLGMSEAAMLDLRGDGVKVVAVLPGSVATGFNPVTGTTDDSWKLAAEDVAEAVSDILRYPDRALPSRIELRPTKPPSARK